MSIEEVEKQVRLFLKTEYRTDALYRVAILVSQIGDIAKIVYHSSENNPDARPVCAREDEISVFGEAVIHLIALMISRDIKINDALEAGIERLEDRDGYKKKCEIVETDKETVIKGEFGFPGVAQGTAIVMPSVSKAKILKLLVESTIDRGQILVTKSLSIDSVTHLTAYLSVIHLKAMVVDHGGKTSHAAIFAKEIGIPCVTATGIATEKIKSGNFVLVDGDKAEVVFRHKEVRK